MSRSAVQVAVALALALAIFAGTNWQAVRVVGVDFRHPVALDRRASAPALQKDLRHRLRKVRHQAQRGERSVEDYETVHAALAEAVGSLAPQDLDRLVPPARRP